MAKNKSTKTNASKLPTTPATLAETETTETVVETTAQAPVAEASTINAETLVAAGQKAEQAKAERRERTVKGAHLLNTLKETAEKAGLEIVEKSGFFQILGASKGRRVYLAKKGGRVDLSGFSVEDEAITQISETEARDKHLGKVRGMLNFDCSDEQVLAAYGLALTKLAEVVEEAPKAAPVAKPAKAPKAAKEETPAAEETETPAETTGPDAE